VKYLTYLLLGLIVAIQWPLWFGKGGWLKVWDMNHQLNDAKAGNAKLALRNAGLDAEVRDLKQGLDAIEERARTDLGLIKPGEIFIQVVDKPAQGRKQP